MGHLVAKDRGIAIDDVDVEVEDELDPRKYEGESDLAVDVRVG